MLVFCLFLTAAVLGLGLNEPPDGKLILSAWLDTTNGDRPVDANARMGFNFGAFQYAQTIPVTTFEFPESQIYATGTDALIYLTVYAGGTSFIFSDADIQVLTQQCGRINNAGRKILLRFFPEMNGNWFTYGQQPSEYIALWKRVYSQLQIDSNQTAMVWAPSSANGYPYNYPITIGSQNIVQINQASVVTSHNFQLLDTNGDGVVNNLDDAFSPYYPGDEFVDWIGMSVYHYAGETYPWDYNSVPVVGEFEKIFNLGNFYSTYAIKRDKPMMISESGAAYHTNTLHDPGNRSAPVPTEVDIKQAFWRQFLTNATFVQTYSKIKLMCLFEFYKPEDSVRASAGGFPDWRDFRVTVNKTTRDAFISDFQSVSQFYIPATKPSLSVDPFDSSSGALDGRWYHPSVGVLFLIAGLVFDVL